MNCHVCGKKIIAGYALCGECGGHIGNGIEKTRLGNWVHHPEELIKLLMDDVLFGEMFCKRKPECMEMAGDDIPEEACRQCCMDWLMEKVEGA